MSTFSEALVTCMQGHGLPVASVENVTEALEFVDKLHSAWENAGGGEELTIVALIAAGAFVGVDEGVLAALEAVGQVAAALYISACIGCIASVAIDDLKGLFASNDLPDYVVAELNNEGVALSGTAVA